MNRGCLPTVDVSPPRRRAGKRVRHKPARYANCTRTIHHHALTALSMDADGARLRYETAIKGPDGARWEEGSTRELERLVTDTKTGEWIHLKEVPQGRTISYYNPQLSEKRRPEADFPGGIEYRVRGTYGGNRNDFTGLTIAETADIPTVKILLNAVVSDPKANWLTTDISDFYLGTPMDRPEYMRVPTKYIPAATMKKHNLHSLVHNGGVIMKLNKGIYGLKQAGRLAQQRLIKHLAAHGYTQTKNSTCLFKHATNGTVFTLVVDDFGVKYYNKADAQHLLDTLEKLYRIKTNWTGDHYIGFDIRFDTCINSQLRTVALSMPRYLPNALKRFKIGPHRPVHNPIDYHPGKFNAIQTPTPLDPSPPCTAAETKRIQRIIGVLLYYDRAIDATFATAVSKVSSAQANATQNVLAAAERLLEYAATHPTAELVYYASKMQLIVHSDASYLSETHSRSRAAGAFFLGDQEHPDILNAPILCTTEILDVVVAAAAEAEYGATFINTKRAVPLQHTLQDLECTQQPVLLFTDNKCTDGIANDTVTQRHSKAMDMRYHFVRDRVRQGQLIVKWAPGHTNLADYLSKAHPTKHFVAMRPFFVTTPPTDASWTTVTRSSAPTGGHTGRLTTAQLPDPRAPPRIQT